MAFNFGAFAGGLAAGGMAAYKLGLETEEAKERKKDREIARERGLQEIAEGRDRAADRRREQEYKAEREKFIRDSTMEQVQDYDEIAGVATGMRYVPRKLSASDLMRVHEGVAALDYRYGKMDPTQAIAMDRSLRQAKDENAFEAWSAYQRTGDPKEAAKAFNSRGAVKMDESSMGVEERVDPLTKQKYKVLKGKTVDGNELVFDPVEVGRAQGGVRGHIESLEKAQKVGLEERKVAASEQEAAAKAKAVEGEPEERRARAGYYNALGRAAGTRAEAAGGKLTDKDKAKYVLSLNTAIDKELAPRKVKDAGGVESTVTHELDGYASEVSRRAGELWKDHGYDPSMLGTVKDKAMLEVREKVGKMHDAVKEAFQYADKDAPAWYEPGSAREHKQARMKEAIDKMRGAGLSVQEIKRAAKAQGFDTRLIDEAEKYKPKAKPQSSGRIAPASGGGKDYSGLWN